jgi:hypothetical protein
MVKKQQRMMILEVMDDKDSDDEDKIEIKIPDRF